MQNTQEYDGVVMIRPGTFKSSGITRETELRLMNNIDFWCLCNILTCLKYIQEVSKLTRSNIKVPLQSCSSRWMFELYCDECAKSGGTKLFFYSSLHVHFLFAHWKSNFQSWASRHNLGHKYFGSQCWSNIHHVPFNRKANQAL